MGVALRELVPRKETSLEELKGKAVAVDALNTLYQFLSTIRTKTGELLSYKGIVTSHLVGLFSRCTALMREGIKLVFVFDGEVPFLKSEELHRRAELKAKAIQKYEEAKEEGIVEEMRKYAARTSKVSDEMIEDSKTLLTLLGIPIVQAPSEGEAQAAFIVKRGDAFAVSSQDYDSLLFGAPRLVQNLAISPKRAGKVAKPVMIELKEVLEKNRIDQERLIALAMLIGTDYNPGGIHGIGPKTALKIVKASKDLKDVFEKVNWKEHFSTSWEEVFETIAKMPVEKNYSLEWKNPSKKELIDFLVKERGFSEEKVFRAIEGAFQKGLGDF